MRLRRWLLRPVAIAVSSCFTQGWCNPTGPHIVNGAVTFQRPDARTLNMTNSPGAIINWQGFSIGANEVTRFVQQSASSAVLNRVVGADVSRIYGQ
ncbi:MAG: filamentous hemagglutinin N-terminal domain-containing protein, partial [Burkholderiales bacterium]